MIELIEAWKIYIIAQAIAISSVFAFGVLAIGSIMTICNAVRLARRYK